MIENQIKKIASDCKLIVNLVHTIRHKKAVKKIKEKKRKKEKLKIIIGASGTNQDSWIATEQKTLDLLDPKKWDGLIDRHSINNILAEHVFEHLTKNEGIKGIQTCLKFLKIGGNLRIAVPDSFHHSKTYFNYSKPDGFGAGASDHKEFYNYQTIKEIIKPIINYVEIDFIEYYDEKGILNTKKIDKEKGIIERTVKNQRFVPGTDEIYSSLILDITLKKEFDKDDINE